jgi:hypothetical protein
VDVYQTRVQTHVRSWTCVSTGTVNEPIAAHDTCLWRERKNQVTKKEGGGGRKEGYHETNLHCICISSEFQVVGCPIARAGAKTLQAYTCPYSVTAVCRPPAATQVHHPHMDMCPANLFSSSIPGASAHHGRRCFERRRQVHL